MKGMIGLLALLASAVHADNEAQDDAEAKPPCALGFCMGQTIEGEAEGDATGVSFRTYEHRAFSGGLTVYWTAATGVCMLRGFQRILSPDRFGNAHKREVERYTDLVARKYGDPTESYDFANAGSIWADKPQYWLMGLKQGERHYTNNWYEEDLPDGFLTIAVIATSEHLVTVQYEFANFDKCIEEGKQSFGDDF